jgi:hypothetical protein
MTFRVRTSTSIIAASVLLMSCVAAASDARMITHATQADFEAGKLSGIIVTSFGELRLGRALSEPMPVDARVGAVECLLDTPEGLLVGTSLPGSIRLIDATGTKTLAQFDEDRPVQALMSIEGVGILAGVGGAAAQVIAIAADGTTRTLVTLDRAQYVWSVARTPDNKMLAATGPEGLLYEIDPAAASARVVFDSAEHNLLSVAHDGQKTAYVGTEPNGLVLAVNLTDGSARALFDAAESEVGTLLLDPRGVLYAATSQFVEPTEVEATADAPAGFGLMEGLTHSEEPAMPEPPDEGSPENPIPDEQRAEPEPADAETPVVNPVDEAHAGPVRPPSTEPATGGNAVYRIDPDGLVSELHRVPGTIRAMLMEDQTLVIASSGPASVSLFGLSDQSHTTLYAGDARHVTSMIKRSDGGLAFGTAIPAAVKQLGPGLAGEGTYVSTKIDAGSIARIGRMRLDGTMPDGTSLTVSMRTSNAGDEQAESLWSAWTEPVAATRFVQMPAGPARFIQYRLTLTGDGQISPVVTGVTLAYQTANRPPQVMTLTVTQPEPVEGQANRHLREIAWEAIDPDEHAMLYAIDYRSASGEWLGIAEKLTEPSFTWDTRTVPEGRYLLRVRASDVPANSANDARTGVKLSAPVLVDNTPPVIGDIETTTADGRTTVRFRVVDRGGIVRRVEYAMERPGEWRRVRSVDTIDDSPDESYELVLDRSGTSRPVVLIVRAGDDGGNEAYQTITLRP